MSTPPHCRHPMTGLPPTNVFFLFLLTLSGFARGEVLITRQQLSYSSHSCALAMITLVTNEQAMNNGAPKQMLVKYVKADIYDDVLMLVFDHGETTGKRWIAHPRNADCRGEGIVTMWVRCTTTCHSMQTGQEMTLEEAKEKLQLANGNRYRRNLDSLDKLRTLRN